MKLWKGCLFYTTPGSPTPKIGNYIQSVKRYIIIFMITTRMTTFIKAKLKKSDDQTNIDKYRVAANITENHIISKSYEESSFQN